MGRQRFEGPHKHVEAVKSATGPKDKGIFGISTVPYEHLQQEGWGEGAGSSEETAHPSGGQHCTTLGISPAITTISS